MSQLLNWSKNGQNTLLFWGHETVQGYLILKSIKTIYTKSCLQIVEQSTGRDHELKFSVWTPVSDAWNCEHLIITLLQS